MDLSSVRHMINAAEPVRVDDLELFRATFEHCGLNPRAVFPTYGLAEHTVFVCTNGTQVPHAWPHIHSDFFDMLRC